MSASDLSGQIAAGNFSNGLRPVEVVSSLPTIGNFAGRMAFLTTDSKLYRHTGTAWTPSVTSSDITGTLSDAQLSAISAAKVTGQITGTQITDGAISTAKLAASAVTAAQIAAGTITANEIAANTITAGQIAAGTITAAQIAAASLTAAQIAAGTITANELAANSITAAKISAGAVGATAIAASSIDATKMNVTDLSAISANLGTITVDTAHIGTAQVDTLQVAGGAISISGSASAPLTNIGANGTIIVCSLTLAPNEAGTVAIWVTGTAHGASSGAQCTFDVLVNGTSVETYIVNEGNGTASFTAHLTASMAAGSNTIALQAHDSAGLGGSAKGDFIAIGLQR